MFLNPIINGKKIVSIDAAKTKLRALMLPFHFVIFGNGKNRYIVAFIHYQTKNPLIAKIIFKMP